MHTVELDIINTLGLHARAAAKLVALASGFQADIELKTATKSANGKSIMGVMMLAASQGTRLTLCADGADEHAAVQALSDLINNRFDEPQ